MSNNPNEFIKKEFQAELNCIFLRIVAYSSGYYTVLV